MTVKGMEGRTGMARANIRYYEGEEQYCKKRRPFPSWNSAKNTPSPPIWTGTGEKEGQPWPGSST